MTKHQLNKKNDTLFYFAEQKEEMNARNIKKAHIHIPNVEEEWNSFLKEWTGYSEDLDKIIPPTEQIMPLIESMMKEKVLYDSESSLLYDRRPRIIGYGQSGIVVQKIYDDWPKNRFGPVLLHCKLGHNLNREYEVLKQIRDNNKDSRPKHFPYLREDKCIWNDKDVVGLIMENNSGLDLNYYVGWGSNRKGYAEVVRVGQFVIESLIEMNNAGIRYHRDIRPDNILITSGFDTFFGNAILLDLEYAVKDGTPGRIDGNRTFGGLNDFISLGQALYYTATGESIFASKKGKDKFLRDIPDDIQRNRYNAYAGEGQIDKTYLAKVNKKIPYKNLANVITSCLTAKHDDIDKVYRVIIDSTR